MDAAPEVRGKPDSDIGGLGLDFEVKFAAREVPALQHDEIRATTKGI